MLGTSADGASAVAAYFIMGRSENSRNRVFVTDGDGIRTQAFDPSKMVDPSLIIYAPVRVLGDTTIVTNGDQTDTVYDQMLAGKTFEESCGFGNLNRMLRTIPLVFLASSNGKTAISMHCPF